MGHSLRSGDVTDLYTKVMKESMREAVGIFDGIFADILESEGAELVSIADRR